MVGPKFYCRRDNLNGLATRGKRKPRAGAPPHGEDMRGNANFDRDGRNWTIRTSSETIINWKSFSIDAS
ncbi:MAG: hypothetical protein KGY81_03325 [Phycisphaerae bacterium]|jgi:hypothetical protein|nr:hypothetical protein [Phycisphaerae bacterium]